MAAMIWKDVRNGRVAALSSDVAGPDAPLIATSTMASGKRLGRSISADFRIESDLRRTNLFCAKSDYPDVHVADIQRIAEREVALKSKWPHFENTLRKARH